MSKNEGYKNPPANGQFKPGQSGNSRGRPKDRPNTANILRRLLNKSVPVRKGDETLMVPAAQAIILALYKDGMQGSARAVQAYMDILAMTGRTNELTDETLERTRMHIPRALTMEEMNLKMTECRDKDRHRYRRTAESDLARFAANDDGTRLPVEVPQAIADGDKQAANHNLDGAIAAYKQEVLRCREALTADDSDDQARADFRRVVGRIGLLADEALMAGRFEKAKAIADVALAEGSSPFWMPPDAIGPVVENLTWIRVIRAHAMTFLGDVDLARQVYLSFHSPKRVIQPSWENSILQDFARLRAAGHDHWLMSEIETHLTDEGWLLTAGNREYVRLEMSREDSAYVKSHPDDIKSGDLLARHGEYERAIIAYTRCLFRIIRKMNVTGKTPASEANLQKVIEHMKSLGEQLLTLKKFKLAETCADDALQHLQGHADFKSLKARAQAGYLQQGAPKGWRRREEAGSRLLPGDEGWERCPEASTNTAPTAPAGNSKPNSAQTRTSALLEARDIQSGQILEHKGMPDEGLPG